MSHDKVTAAEAAKGEELNLQVLAFQRALREQTSIEAGQHVERVRREQDRVHRRRPLGPDELGRRRGDLDRRPGRAARLAHEAAHVTHHLPRHEHVIEQEGRRARPARPRRVDVLLQVRQFYHPVGHVEFHRRGRDDRIFVARRAAARSPSIGGNRRRLGGKDRRRCQHRREAQRAQPFTRNEF
jgi:hypothetical protein